MDVKTIYRVQTHYHDIKVIEEGDIRRLIFGYGLSQEQGAVDIKKPDSPVYDFYSLFMHSFLFVPEPVNVLIIGLGAGVCPRLVSHYFPKANIDIIEIDGEVVSIAKKFFFFKETDKIKVYIGDAFNVIQKIDKEYDVILIDAFDKHYIPTHIMSLEFTEFVSFKLKEDGILAVNMCNIHPSYFSHVNTIRTKFGDNIFCLKGFTNPYALMLYALKQYREPFDVHKLLCHFLIGAPSKLEITDDIKNAKIIELKKYIMYNTRKV